MSSLVTNPVFQAYAASAIALGLNLIFIANATAISRAKAGEGVNPEDGKTTVYHDGNDITQRWIRAHRNALENLPLFLITAFLLTLTTVGATFATVLFAIFVVTRWLHTICYVKSVQPWRTAFFAIGSLTQVVLLGALGYYVFAV